MSPAGCSGITLGPVYTSGSPGPSWCAITFDEHLGKYTPSVLSAFADAAMHGTFFCVGKEATDHPYLAAAILNAGHEIGNHSWNHARLTQLADHGAAQMSMTQAKLAARYGYTPCTFRPPFGALDANVIAAATARSMATVKWSKAANIFETNPSKVSADVVAATVKGSIVVLHQVPAHVAALPSILSGIAGKGLTSVPVVQLLGGSFT